MWAQLLSIVKCKLGWLRRKELSATVRASGRLVAVKNPSSPELTQKHSPDHIEISVQEKIARHGYPPESVRVADTQGISVNVDSAEDGSYTQSVTLGQKNVPQNEEGSGEVCRIAIEYLNAAGDNWDLETLRVCDQHGDTDASVSDRNDKLKTLNIQVTRATPVPEYYKLLRLCGEVTTSGQNPEELARNLFKAIDRKAKKLAPVQRANLVLAIDVLNTPAVSLNATIEAFKKLYPRSVNSLGFRSILVVGPVVSLTHRLDT